MTRDELISALSGRPAILCATHPKHGRLDAWPVLSLDGHTLYVAPLGAFATDAFWIYRGRDDFVGRGRSGSWDDLGREIAWAVEGGAKLWPDVTPTPAETIMRPAAGPDVETRPAILH
ncbi:hypothetical protein [Defluviimonas salinarum]|uniref:Pyridoxamine 5'-phosphate oxidase family protein n=1 Tax=Defluviimonas salinarum TaxID=2992147 RepID=A0ABT3J5D3_9RHOB|nr:hypothetical protein [Defluviimonas salinarum]MCW3782897.1 hypothetical protein [Defluviimonas salinarum]